MKIFMYSDLHISKTSSILPLTDDKYSYRQKMIMRTGEWLESIINKEKPDLIINLGDTFDQHTVTSYDIDTAYEFFKCFRMFNIPHIVLVGNHEMINQEFNAVKILNNINNITVITDPCSIDTSIILPQNNESNIKLALLPYCNFKELLELPEGTFLFSHIDIQGSIIRQNIELPEGLTNEQLNRYNLVFNGHIHKSSIKNNVVNVGSITTHSFSDDENSIPTCYIFDTKTLDLKQFKSNICPLFRKVEINNIDDLIHYIDLLDNNFTYCIHCICPFEIKEEVKEILKTTEKVIANRLNVKIEKVEEIKQESTLNLQSNIDIIKSFETFLNESIQNNLELKYPLNYYKEVLNNI